MIEVKKTSNCFSLTKHVVLIPTSIKIVRKKILNLKTMEPNHVSNHDWRETIKDISAGWINTSPLTNASWQI